MHTGADKYVLAVDLGTSAGKVALFSMLGKLIGWESEPVPLQVVPGGGAEQDPNDWWKAILNSCKKLLAKESISRNDVVAFCVAAQGEGTVPIDRDGNALMNALLWLDARGAKYAQQYAAGPISIDGYNVARLLRWIRITGGLPAKSGKDLIGHMLFIKYERPEVYEKTYKFLNVPDYINFRLTGKPLTTPDSIFSTWMTDNRDLNDFHYHEGLLKQSPIDRDKLPEIRPPVDILGLLKPEIADELGLSHDVKVVAGAFDVPAAAIGAGTVEDYAPMLCIGTSTLLSAHVPFKKTDITSYIASLPCGIPGKYLLMAGQDMAGGNLIFLRDNILFHKDALLQADPENFFQAVNQIAQEVPPGSNGVIYTPWLYAERAPVDDPTIRAGFHNISLGTTRGDIVRAIFEGVALNTRWLLGPCEKFIGGRKMDPINMVGGGAQSSLWCQIHADVLGRTIRQVKDPLQVNARGAALMASVGLGYITFDDIPALTEYEATYRPNPANRALYDELYGIFVDLYRKNRSIYARLNRA